MSKIAPIASVVCQILIFSIHTWGIIILYYDSNSATSIIINIFFHKARYWAHIVKLLSKLSYMLGHNVWPYAHKVDNPDTQQLSGEFK